MSTNTRTGISTPIVLDRLLRPAVKHPLSDIPVDVAVQLNGPQDDAIVYSFDHYTQYGEPLAEGSAGPYTLIGTTGVAVVVLESEDYGVIRIETGATENDNAVLRQVAHTVNYSTTDKIVWAAHLSLSNADDMEFFAGITLDNGDFVAGLPASGLFFSKAETATVLSFQVRESGTSSTQAFTAPTLTDGGDVVLAIVVESGNVTPYIYDVTGAAWTEGTTVLSSDANMPLATDDLRMHIALETGEAAANNVQLDWMYLGKDAA